MPTPTEHPTWCTPARCTVPHGPGGGMHRGSPFVLRTKTWAIAASLLKPGLPTGADALIEVVVVVGDTTATMALDHVRAGQLGRQLRGLARLAGGTA